MIVILPQFIKLIMLKNTTIKSIFLIYATIFIFSSCEVQKRRYLKGYSINSISSKNSSLDKNDINFGNNKLTVTKNSKIKTLSNVHITDSSDTKLPISKNLLSSNSNKITDEIILSSTSNYSPILNYTSDQKVVSNRKNHFKKVNTVLKTEKQTKIDEPKNENFKRKMAIIIGISLLLMAVLAIFVIPAVTGAFVLGDAALTALNVTSNISKFWWGVIGWIGILLLDVAISLGTYNYYKKKSKKIAAVTGGLRLAYSGILAVAIAQLLKVTISTPALGIYNALKMFSNLWSLGLIAFGLHLIALGILYNNEGGKKWVNILIKSLLIIAGLGYMIINIGMLLVPNPIAFAALLQPFFLIPMIFGETLYAIWMLIKGGKQNNKLPKTKD